jgi:hypothetical protein
MKVNKDILSIYEEILTNNKNILSELELVKLSDTNYSNLKYDSDGTQYDSVNKPLLDDINAAAQSAGITATITTASSGHSDETITGSQSRHPKKTAVDISILNSVGSGGATNSGDGNPDFRLYGNKLKDALVSMGYTLNSESGNDKAVLWQTSVGGNHYNHLHVSNNLEESGDTPTETPDETPTDTPEDNEKKSDWSVSGVPKDTFMSDMAKSIASKFLPESVDEQKRFDRNTFKSKKINENIERIKKLL